MKSQPIQIKELHQIAQNKLNQGDYVKAHALCVQIIEQQPRHADAYFLLGIINSEIGQINKAIQLIEKAISFKPLGAYFAHLAKCYSLVGNMSAVLAAIKHVPVEQVNQGLTLDTIGVALSRVGDHQKALCYFEKALSQQKDNPAYFYNYAVSSKFAGLFEQAKKAFETAIELSPDHYQAHFALSDLGGVTKENNHIARLLSLLDVNSHPDSSLHIGHALAKEYEALGEYDKSFEVLERVKQQKLATIDYKFSDDDQLFDYLSQFPVADNITQLGHDSSQPIFVVGMPRSGTTLVERILSNHTDVKSCGELQDFGVAVKEVTGTSSQRVLDVETLQAAQSIDFAELGKRYIQRTKAVTDNSPKFIDKLPFNFFHIDLIRKALPNAKIICLLRNPMDTCVGNFRQLFSINSPYYSYAYNLQTIGRFYAEFYQLANRWESSNTDNFMLLNYESLVATPEQKIRELLEFCGLSWQEKCLHAEQNTAPVSTASKVQVREPINAKSIGRWKKFGPNTKSLESFLQHVGIPID